MEEKNSLSVELGIGTLEIIVPDPDETKAPRLVFRPNNCTRPICHTAEDDDGNLVIDLTVGTKIPRIGQEVTMDGRTFEVIGVRIDGNGFYQVCRDTDGVWMAWK